MTIKRTTMSDREIYTRSTIKRTTMTEPHIEFTVYGKPQQRGSKVSGVVYKKGGGGGMVMVPGANGSLRPMTTTRDANVKSTEWMRQVKQEAGRHYAGMPLMQGPVILSAIFFFARPQSHMRTGKFAGHVKATAPKRHQQTPDLSKLVRAIEDAMTDVIYADDRQICLYDNVSKEWTIEQAKAVISVTPIDDGDLQAIEKFLDSKPKSPAYHSLIASLNKHWKGLQ